MSKIVNAMWRAHLFVTCPHCGEYFDLLDTPNFWEDREIYYCESGTFNSENQSGKCLVCQKDFNFRCTN